jgi:hypothetical protein
VHSFAEVSISIRDQQRSERYVAALIPVLWVAISSSLRCLWMTSSARPGARYGQFWRWILTEVGVAVGQPGSTDGVLCFARVPAWSVVWVLAGDIGECRGWLLCSSSA